MTPTQEEVRGTVRRHRRRIRSSRSARFFLGAVGATGLALGAGLFVFGWWQPNGALRRAAWMYVACSGSVLCVRAAMDKHDEARKRRYVRQP